MSQEPSDKRKVSEPLLPDIPKCPRCGANILIGDTRCTNCGYNVEKLSDQVKSQPPIVISVLFFVLGILIALAGLGTSNNTLQFLLLLLGGGLVIAGGLYYAFDLLVLSANDRRKPTGKK